VASPGAGVQSLDGIDSYVKEAVHSANALVGTCRMGRSDDPLAVVDPELKVSLEACERFSVCEGSMGETEPTGTDTPMLSTLVVIIMISLR
jgi:choline dehydrogenase-like flavoprotein